MYEPASGFPLLTLYTFMPVLGMVVVLLLPSKRADIIKTVAAAAAAVPMLLGLHVMFSFHDTGAIQYRESFLWIEGLNVHYTLGMDGLSAPMIVLSGLVGFVAVVASWGIDKQVKGYFALILLLLTGMNGVFCSLDFFLFYVFWELMLLPMYFLIGVWGGPKRVYAAIKFFLYTMAGSVFMLVVLLGCWYWSDGRYATETDITATNHAKEAIVARRAAAFDELAKAAGPERPDLVPAGIDDLPPALRRRILASHGVPMAEGRADALLAAKEIQMKLDNLPPTRSGDARAIEFEKTSMLSRIQLQRTFDFLELKERYELFLGGFNFLGYYVKFAAVMFIFLYIAFAIKVPVFPFHTWLPWAHVEAPTAISVILAGILLKMGVYGFFRVSFPLFPTEAVRFAVPIALFGVFNILYGAACAMAQDDMKKLVAYSSVSHMGFCMLGMAAMTKWGMVGSSLQMFNHGLSTSMMFLLVGVIYDRAHHRDINKFGGLATVMPVYAGVMTLALFASMGLPGLSGFISEFLVFVGAFRSSMGDIVTGESYHLHVSFQTMTIVSVLGVILTAAYLLWMLQRVFFGPLDEKYKDLPDLNAREWFCLAPLAILIVAFGVYPQPLINLTSKSVENLQAFVLESRKIENSEKSTVVDAAPPAASGASKELAAKPQDPGARVSSPASEGSQGPSASKPEENAPARLGDAVRPQPLRVGTAVAKAASIGDVRAEGPPGRAAIAAAAGQ